MFNLVQRILLILYAASIWITLLFFTPHSTTAHSGGTSIRLMQFHPLWGGDEKLKFFSKIDYNFIWIEIVMISILFIALILVFQSKNN